MRAAWPRKAGSIGEHDKGKRSFAIIAPLFLCPAILAVILAVILAGCAHGDDSGDGRIRLALITTYRDSVYWLSVKDGAENMADELENVEVAYMAPTNWTNADEQISMLRECVDEGYDGIILAAIDMDALVEPIKSVKAAGLPVVMIDTAASENVYDVLFATDNVDAGRISARLMAEAIGGEGEVAVVNFSDSALAAMRREHGFVTEIAENFKNIRVVGVEYCNSDRGLAEAHARRFLIDYPGLDGIWATNGLVVRGVMEGLSDDKSDVKVVGFDNIEELETLMRQGRVDAAVVQNPGAMGSEAVACVVEILNGKKNESNFVDTGVVVVTKDNIDDPDVRALLGWDI